MKIAFIIVLYFFFFACKEKISYRSLVDEEVKKIARDSGNNINIFIQNYGKPVEDYPECIEDSYGVDTTDHVYLFFNSKHTGRNLEDEISTHFFVNTYGERIVSILFGYTKND